MDREFYNEIKDLLRSDAVQQLKIYTHHKHATRFEHSLYVAYRSFVLAKKLGWDSRAAARGGLLHDLYLYDQHDDTPRKGWHLLVHPAAAYAEASARFDLTPVEKDIILKHMWPIAVHLPKYRESVAVMLMDKYCACMEALLLGKRKLRRLGLTPLAI